MENNNLGLVVENDRVVVSSVVVANAFHKNNKDVLRSIDSVSVMEEFFNKNFFRSTYVGINNREYPDYKMTRDGFMLVVMGFTGKEALTIKIMFIDAFNAMEAELKQIHQGKGTFIPNFDNPVEACEQWLKERKENIALTKQLENAAPKIQFADAISSSETDIYVNDLAKILKQNGVPTGEIRLYAWLRDNAWVTKAGYNRNLPTQKAMELGLFRIKETPHHYGNNPGTVISKTTMVTPKGQQYFLDLFLNKEDAVKQLTMKYDDKADKVEEVKKVAPKEPKAKAISTAKQFINDVKNWERLEKYLDLPVPKYWYKLSIYDRMVYINKNINLSPSKIVGDTETRKYVSNIEAWIECFGGDFTNVMPVARAIGTMIESLGGWKKSGKYRKYLRHYGQQHIYIRDEQ